MKVEGIGGFKMFSGYFFFFELRWVSENELELCRDIILFLVIGGLGVLGIELLVFSEVMGGFVM